MHQSSDLSLKFGIVSEDRTCNIAALTVSQLRWMNSLSYDVIITKLNEVLPVCPLPVSFLLAFALVTSTSTMFNVYFEKQKENTERF